MIGIVKQSLFKATGGAYLINQELNKPTIDLYWKRNQRSILTPNILLYGQPIMIPEERLDEDTPEIKR